MDICFEPQTRQNTSEAEISQKFIELTLEVQRLGKTVQIEIIPFIDATLPYFSVLPWSKKIHVCQCLQNFVEICHETLASGNSLMDSRALVWNTIKYFKWKPSSDLFAKLLETDIVEIYDMDHVQIFRNFQFFEFCSYTLEDVFCRPWQDLFVRFDDTVFERLISCLTRLFTNPSHETIPTDVGFHHIQESKSVFRHTIDIDVKYISKLFGENRQVVAYVVTESAQFVKVLSREEQNQMMEEFYYPDKRPPFLSLVDRPPEKSRE